MAEQTGDVELDALLQRFKRRSLPADFRRRWGDESGSRLKVADMRFDDEAEGMCDAASTAFIAFLEEHGVAADYLRDPNYETWYPFVPAVETLGYDEGGAPDHCVVAVPRPTGVFMIDWTASQYGYEEFPMVMRQAADRSWQREWTDRPSLNNDTALLPVAELPATAQEVSIDG